MIHLELSTGRWFGKIYKRALPTSFSEVPQARLLRLIRILMTYPDDIAMPFIIELLLDVPKSVLAAISVEELSAIAQHLQWARLDPSPILRIDSFEVGGVRYYFPKDNFENGKAIEYPMADGYLMNYLNGGNEFQLVKMAATLCREKNEDEATNITAGDIRVPLLSRSEAEHRAQRMKSIPTEYLVLVMFYFSGVKQLVAKLYGAHLFDQEDTPEDPAKASPFKKKPNGETFGWWGIYMEMADNVANLDAVYQTNFHTLCMMLVRRRKAQKEAEERLKQNDQKH